MTLSCPSCPQVLPPRNGRSASARGMAKLSRPQSPDRRSRRVGSSLCGVDGEPPAVSHLDPLDDVAAAVAARAGSHCAGSRSPFEWFHVVGHRYQTDEQVKVVASRGAARGGPVAGTDSHASFRGTMWSMST